MWSAGIMNSLGGAAFIGAIVILFQGEEHKGYENFEQSL
jgi:hypothetical protein